MGQRRTRQDAASCRVLFYGCLVKQALAKDALFIQNSREISASGG